MRTKLDGVLMWFEEYVTGSLVVDIVVVVNIVIDVVVVGADVEVV